MKKTLLLFLMLINYVAFSQEIKNKPVEYTEVVAVTNTDAKALYSKARLWLAQNYKDATKIIKLDDSDNQKLLAKPLIRFTSRIFMGGAGREGWISYDLEISCKDGRYKYSFSNFVHDGRNTNIGLITDSDELPNLLVGKKQRKEASDEIRSTISSTVLPLIASLKTAMETNDNW